MQDRKNTIADNGGDVTDGLCMYLVVYSVLIPFEQSISYQP
jgi:hypothetical protein